jgi:secondary thiamine-phosphate synthase enzyme
VRTLTVATRRKTELVDVTAAVRDAIAGETGSAVVLFVPHTTAGIVLQASGPGASAVAADVEAALERIVDERWGWRHTAEGDRNPWAHVRAALTASSLTIPLDAGRMALGQLQAIFLCEFDGPRERRLHVSVLP